jgi:hypothetical protein
MTSVGETADNAYGARTGGRLTRVAAATMVGTMIEAFDFLAYLTAAALVFNKLYFPTVDWRAISGRTALHGRFARHNSPPSAAALLRSSRRASSPASAALSRSASIWPRSDRLRCFARRDAQFAGEVA